MSTLEMICWGSLAIIIVISVGGMAFMILFPPGPAPETDFDVAEADLADLRAASQR